MEEVWILRAWDGYIYGVYDNVEAAETDKSRLKVSVTGADLIVARFVVDSEPVAN